MPPPYSADFLIAIQRTITTERLTRYLGATNKNLSQALALYEYNVQLSEMLFGILQGLEVTVRNAEHAALTISYATPKWYDAAPLSPYWRDQLQKAKAKPGARKPGKVIAELTFGFWVDLLKADNHRALWVDRKLNAAFPNTVGLTRGDIHTRLKAIQLLRNRISHHEPILTSGNVLYTGDGVITLAELLEPVEWACKHTGLWLKSQFRYDAADRLLQEVAAMNISL